MPFVPNWRLAVVAALAATADNRGAIGFRPSVLGLLRDRQLLLLCDSKPPLPDCQGSASPGVRAATLLGTLPQCSVPVWRHMVCAASIPSSTMTDSVIPNEVVIRPQPKLNRPAATVRLTLADAGHNTIRPILLAS